LSKELLIVFGFVFWFWFLSLGLLSLFVLDSFGYRHNSVPDPVMFQRFLDAADYWFGYPDNSIAGSYDPARECFVVLANDQTNAANAAEAGDGEVPPNPGTGPHQGARPSAPPPHRRGVPTSTRSWPN
jgi:hypothetical protein